jgi:hydrogenase-4 membrane subunit HyfE
VIGTVVIAAALVPFLVYGGRDNRMHFKLRKVSVGEHAIHAVLFIALVVLCIGVFRRDHVHVLFALAAFVPPALVDELVFHRGIPSEEHDVHAKEHLLLLVFLVVGALVGALEAGMVPLLTGPRAQ